MALPLWLWIVGCWVLASTCFTLAMCRWFKWLRGDLD